MTLQNGLDRIDDERQVKKILKTMGESAYFCPIESAIVAHMLIICRKTPQETADRLVYVRKVGIKAACERV